MFNIKVNLNRQNVSFLHLASFHLDVVVITNSTLSHVSKKHLHTVFVAVKGSHAKKGNKKKQQTLKSTSEQNKS